MDSTNVFKFNVKSGKKLLKNYLTFKVTSDILNNVRKINIIQLANTTPYRAVFTAPSTHKNNRYSDTHAGEKIGGKCVKVRFLLSDLASEEVIQQSSKHK